MVYNWAKGTGLGDLRTVSGRKQSSDRTHPMGRELWWTLAPGHQAGFTMPLNLSPGERLYHSWV